MSHTGAQTEPAPDAELERQRAHRAAAILHGAYGSPRHGNKDDPLDELVFIVLSQMTTGPSFNRVYDRLRAAMAEWEQLLSIPLYEFEDLISDAGLVHQKAPRLQAILRKLKQDFGTVSLEPLRGMTDADAERYLTSLPGVGVKTAKCVMMYALNRPVLPVDTHVGRVARRLGLVSDATPYTRIHEALEGAVPPADRYSFHVNAVAHGRAVCLALRPRCSQCPLHELCRYGRDHAVCER